MNPQKIYTLFQSKKERKEKSVAILIDPDKADKDYLISLCKKAELAKIDFLFVGGSLITKGSLSDTLTFIKNQTYIPTIIFPGSNLHLSNEADALFLLSLISGRNADFLIGQHVVAAPELAKLSLEIIPTGYILVDGGKQTTVSYISNTTPIPNNKPDIAASTAKAGELLGLKLIYLDSGSGAAQTVNEKIIETVNQSCKSPIIVGGGINSTEKIQTLWSAGADVVVIGTAIEKDLNFLDSIKALK
jgi:putative glycerol-1-phosphate prenyltransferase